MLSFLIIYTCSVVSVCAGTGWKRKYEYQDRPVRFRLTETDGKHEIRFL